MSAPYTSAEIISLTNLTRQSNGLSPLHPEPRLMQAAATKADAMIFAGSWSHNTPDATSWQFLETAGYRYQIAGENLARNFQHPQQVIDGWLNSPSHRNNLLNPTYTEIGVAVVAATDAKTSVLVVQYMAAPQTSTTAFQAPEYNPTAIMMHITHQSYSWLILLLPILVLIYIKIKQGLLKRPKPSQPHSKHWRN